MKKIRKMDINEKRIFKIVNEKRMSEDDRYILKEAIRGWIKSIDPLFVEEIPQNTTNVAKVPQSATNVEEIPQIIV